jgi:hypothetical protein
MGKAYSRIISIQKFRCILSLSNNKFKLDSDLVFAQFDSLSFLN